MVTVRIRYLIHPGHLLICRTHPDFFLTLFWHLGTRSRSSDSTCRCDRKAVLWTAVSIQLQRKCLLDRMLSSTMLSNRLRPPPASSYEAEDIFSDSLSRLFPGDLPDHHGSPGSYLTYHSPVVGEFKLCLSDYNGEGERKLFAFHIWNASLMLSDLIESNDNGLFYVGKQRLLELGAGKSLPRCASRSHLCAF